jgi:hypothetical protein
MIQHEFLIQSNANSFMNAGLILYTNKPFEQGHFQTGITTGYHWGWRRGVGSEKQRFSI